MVHHLGEQDSILNRFVAQLRDIRIQKDSLRFRRNMERIGEIMAYEISKTLHFRDAEVETPMGVAKSALPAEEPVLATILRAGLPFHRGMLNYFDEASNAFISAYRRHHKDGSFDIHMEYLSCPNLEGKPLILSDAMLATGASMVLTARSLMEHGMPSVIHFATVIASSEGLDYLSRNFPDAHIWIAALDEELTARAYIVPGLGDAGDLAFGEKLQE